MSKVKLSKSKLKLKGGKSNKISKRKPALIREKNSPEEKELFLEKTRQVISDLNSLYKFISEKKNQGDKFGKTSWIMDYENVLIEELKTLTQKIKKIK